MKLRCALAAGVAFSLMGCSVGESEPKPIPPDGTFEQVLHNLGGDELGGLALNQSVSFEIEGELIKLYNLSDRPVDEEAFRQTVGYFEDLVDESPSPTYDVTLYPNGIDEPQSASALVIPRSAKEHDFVLIPPTAEMPPAIGSTAVAATKYFFEQEQTISVVKEPDSDGSETFAANSGLNTEICQAMVDVLFSRTEESGAVEIPEHLAQETVCNSLGAAAQAVFSGVDHDVYREVVESDHLKDLRVAGDRYWIDVFTVTPEQYQDMQAALA